MWWGSSWLDEGTGGCLSSTQRKRKKTGWMSLPFFKNKTFLSLHFLHFFSVATPPIWQVDNFLTFWTSVHACVQWDVNAYCARLPRDTEGVPPHLSCNQNLVHWSTRPKFVKWVNNAHTVLGTQSLLTTSYFLSPSLSLGFWSSTTTKMLLLRG